MAVTLADNFGALAPLYICTRAGGSRDLLPRPQRFPIQLSHTYPMHRRVYKSAARAMSSATHGEKAAYVTTLETKAAHAMATICLHGRSGNGAA